MLEERRDETAGPVGKVAQSTQLFTVELRVDHVLPGDVETAACQPGGWLVSHP